MISRRSVSLALTGILLLVGTTASAAQSPYVPPQLKSTVDSLHNLKAKLERNRDREADLQEKADKLAEEIDRLRSDPKGGFLDDRRLRGKLQQSMKVGEELERLKRAEAGLDLALTDVGRRALALYQLAIDSTFHRIEEVESSREKRGLLEFLLLLRGQKETLLSYLPALRQWAPEEPEATAISHFDSPWEINQKGDFYLDLADRLDKEAVELDLLLADLRQEQMIRQKVSELVEDTELFQGSDEFTVEELPLTAPVTGDELEKTFNPRTEQIGQDYLNFLFSEKIPINQPETRAWTLIDLIRQAENRQEELKERAGLYRQKALYYYQRAREE